MTMKITDIAPDEAQLIELSERLSQTLASASSPENVPSLELDSSYLDAARTALASLSDQVAAPEAHDLPLTRQQIEGYLDFDPEFLDVAKNMLREFISRTEGSRR